MLCKFCEKEIDDKDLFCKYCGQSSCERQDMYRHSKEDFVIACEKSARDDDMSLYLLSAEKEAKVIKNIPEKKVKTPVNRDPFMFLNEPSTYSINIEVGPNRERLRSDFRDILNIDIGPSFTKLLQIDLDTKNCIYPSFLSFQKTPDNVFKEEKFSNPRPLSISLKSFLKEAGLNVGRVSFSVPPPEFVIRTLTLPQMDDNKLSLAIKDEVASFLSFPYKEARIEVYRLSGAASGAGNLMKVMVFAMHKPCIYNLITLANLLGLKLEHIISSHKASFNALQLITKNELYNVAIIDVGLYTTDITIIRDGVICQTNSMRNGLTDLIRAIAASQNVSITKARSILENSDIDITWTDKSNIKFFQILVSPLGEWITNLLMAFKCFGSEYKLEKNKFLALILCGEGAIIKNLNKFVGNQIGINCYNFKMPISNIVNKYNDIATEKAPLLLSSLGLSVANLHKEDEFGEKIELKTDFWSSIFGA